MINRFLTTSMGTLAKISGDSLGSGLLAVVAAIRAPVLRSATADCKLALLMILHAL
jgi:hypothetical protein